MPSVDDLAPTGVLRAVINLGNPVLAQGTAESPRGVAVDLARDLAARLGVGVELRCVTAARDSFDAVRSGSADLGFLALDPDRAAAIAFGPAYAVIESVYAVPPGSPIRTLEEVDRAGVRVGVKAGSAYDLHLSRALRAATPVRGVDGVAVADEQGLEVAAGIRVPVTEWAARTGWRVLEPAFLQIRQAVAVPADRGAAALQVLTAWIEERKRDGSVAAWLERSGRRDATVAD